MQKNSGLVIVAIVYIFLQQKKRLFNCVTLQPCVQIVGAHIIVFVKMSCHFSDLGLLSQQRSSKALFEIEETEEFLLVLSRATVSLG